jgi:hypothetical protein
LAIVVRGVYNRKVGPASGEQALDVLGLRRVAAFHDVLAHEDRVARLRARRACRRLDGRVEVERLRTLALLPGIEAPDKVVDLPLGEAGQGDVDVGNDPELREKAGEELLVEAPADPVEGDPEKAGLLRAEVKPDDRHGLEADAARRDEALVAADDGVRVQPGEDGLDEAERPEAPGQGLELDLGDPAGVCGVGQEPVDRDLLDVESGSRKRRNTNGVSFWGRRVVLIECGNVVGVVGRLYKSPSPARDGPSQATR